MKSELIWPNVIRAVVIAVVVYFAGFYFIEHRRTVKGPWEVTFGSDGQIPYLLINQKTLRIKDFKIRFPGGITANASNPIEVAFDTPGKTAPFGQIKFSDLTFLPGTITFQLFGHTIELVPRVLGVDGKEHPWDAGTPLDLPAKSTDDPK